MLLMAGVGLLGVGAVAWLMSRKKSDNEIRYESFKELCTAKGGAFQELWGDADRLDYFCRFQSGNICDETSLRNGTCGASVPPSTTISKTA
jgi:hypothetical protein